jgi:cell fate (sporulation/competence/biofilm development) regulator YlbF (YheA/YmcA/DUF963 family)
VSVIDEKAQQLGTLIGQGEEYRALLRARDALDEDKDLAEKLKRMEQLSVELQQRVARGEEPEQAHADEYDRLFGDVQSSVTYQRLVAAQTNFDKVMHHVQEQMLEGMRKGAQSRIITLG